MGSLFVVSCPTRLHEMNLRMKEHEQIARELGVPIIAAASRVTLTNVNSESSTAVISTLSNVPSLGLVTEDEDTLSRIKRVNSTISESDIRTIIDTIYLEKHLEEAMKKFFIWHATWSPTVDDNMYQVTFTTPAKKYEQILHYLQTCGIGSKFESSIWCSSVSGNVYIADPKIAFSKHPHTHNTDDSDRRSENSDDDSDDQKKKKKGHWNDFVASIKSRLTVAQVVQTLHNNAAFTFDYMMLIFVAATIAALGLLENSSVALVASMLISPLMGPIIAFVFSCVIHDLSLMKLGALGGFIGLLQCILVGFIFGAFIEWEPVHGPWSDITPWPTSEMVTRSEARALTLGAMIAIPSGVGVALSILAGNSGSLVGVAISASLLPPAVNSGVFWGMAIVVAIREQMRVGSIDSNCHHYLGNKTTYFEKDYAPVWCQNAVIEWAMMGTISLMLTLINIVLIFIIGIGILKIKEFAPYTTRKNLTRFWKEDLKAVREYNTAHGGVMRDEDLLNDINAVEDPDELKKNLETDATFSKINKITGTTIHDLSIYGKKSHTAIQRAPPVPATPQPQAGAWYFSSWFKRAPPPEVKEEAPVVVEEKTRKVIIRRPS